MGNGRKKRHTVAGKTVRASIRVTPTSNEHISPVQVIFAMALSQTVTQICGQPTVPRNHMNHMNHDLPNHPCPPPSASTWIIVFTHTWPSASKPYQSQCKTFHEIFLSTPPSTGSLQEGSQWLHDSQEQRKASSIIVTQTMSIAFAKICGFNSCYSLSWKFDSFQVLILSKWIIKADVFLVAFVGFLFCCRN